MEAHAPLFEKSRGEDAFRQAAIEIQSLKDQAARGDIELAYLDEAGFSAVHPNRSAWAPRGQCHLQGVTLHFLPPYSPELNRIERLWHTIKHTWMAVKCRTAQDLEADVGHVLDNFGTTYKFDFYGK